MCITFYNERKSMQYMFWNITQSNKCNLAGKNNLKIPFVINLLELINDP